MEGGLFEVRGKGVTLDAAGRCACPCSLSPVVQFSVFAMFLTDEVLHK